MLRPLDDDLLLNARVDQDPVGERIIVHGRVIDEDERPIEGALVRSGRPTRAGAIAT